MVYGSRIADLPNTDVLEEIVGKVDPQELEEALLRESLPKFAEPFRSLRGTINEKRD